ncbi:MAG: choice-of-anchor D domain-containing protein, partial [Pyrinomonadaceae bacterium]
MSKNPKSQRVIVGRIALLTILIVNVALGIAANGAEASAFSVMQAVKGFLGFASTATYEETASTTILISEVEAASASGFEWFELVNVSSAAITLNGWTITDNTSSDTIPTVTLQPGGRVIVADSTANFATDHPAFAGTVLAVGTIGNGLANGGDVLTLKDNASTTIDCMSYGTVTTCLNPAPTAGVANTNSTLQRTSNTDTDTASDWTFATETPDGNIGTPAASTLSINDVSLNEGNAGTSTFAFTVSLSSPAPAGGVTFDIATANNTAAAGTDYVASTLTGQTIAAGSSSYTFNVTVNGDTAVEPNETFFVNISNVTGATVGDGQGLGTIQNDDAATPTPAPEMDVDLDGVAVADGSTVDFGSVTVSQQGSARTFTIRNTGTSDLNVTRPFTKDGPNAGNFVVNTSSTVTTIAPGESTTFTVQFIPGSATSHPAAIHITNTDSNENPYDINLIGTGTPAPIIVTGVNSLDFGSVVVGSVSPEQSYNLSGGNLTGDITVTAPSAEYQVSKTSGTGFSNSIVFQQSGGSVNNQTVFVRFSPTSTGTVSGDITHTTAGASKNVSVTGTGVTATPTPTTPEIVITGNGVEIQDGDNSPSQSDATDYGSIPISSSVETTYVIRNTGASSLQLPGTPKVVIGGTNPGDFTVTLEPASVVAGGTETYFTVHFVPQAVGLRTA